MKFFVRTILVAGLPFALSWAYVSTLFKEVQRAFRYAWLEVRIELEGFKKQWRWLDEPRQEKTSETNLIH